MRADEQLTAFVELESAVRAVNVATDQDELPMPGEKVVTHEAVRTLGTPQALS